MSVWERELELELELRDMSIIKGSKLNAAMQGARMRGGSARASSVHPPTKTYCNVPRLDIPLQHQRGFPVGETE